MCITSQGSSQEGVGRSQSESGTKVDSSGPSKNASWPSAAPATCSISSRHAFEKYLGRPTCLRRSPPRMALA